MFRPAPAALLRRSATTAAQQFKPAATAQGRRFMSSSARSEEKSRSWRNTAVRLGLAAGAIYYYNTSPVFADVRSLGLQAASSHETDPAALPTIESVATEKKLRSELTRQSTFAPPQSNANSPTESSAASTSAAASAAAATTTDSEVTPTPTTAKPLDSSPGEIEEEADQQGAFDPETGEINWDCPCLGGMAHGPCGEEFREAFSCFVFSTEEPKGMDCIEKFKGMQDCFRLHPDVYGAELDDTETDDQAQENVTGDKTPEAAAAADTSSPAIDSAAEPNQVRREVQKELDPQDTLQAPKEWHDSTEKNVEAEKKDEKEKGGKKQ